MVPIVCLVGKTAAGKTTLAEGLIAELGRRGYRVASIKHDVHSAQLDQPGKDTWRHAEAGSDLVLLSSPQRVTMFKRVDHDLALNELARLIGLDFDIVIAEGFKQTRAPKIEVHHRGAGSFLCTPEELLAVVSDGPLDVDLPQYAPDDVAGLTNLIENTLLRTRDKEQVVLCVNGEALPLSLFPKSVIASTVTGLVSALKGVGGVGEVEAIELSIRRKARDGFRS
ncbi:molybdopterin-guanine dinucleotide biosynthesis protein B [Chloroflexota bacterium]